MADQGTEGLFSPYLRRQRIKAVCPFLYGKVLDMGCGSGALASLVPAENYFGVDIDEKSLTKARQLYPQHHFQMSLPLVQPVFDTVVSLAVIEHVINPKKFISDLAAYLAPSSKSHILITTPHPSMDWIHTIGASIGLFSRHASEEHEQLLSRIQLKSLAEANGLHVVLYRKFLFGANQLAILMREI